jgi:hypothetical protein
MNSIIRNAAKMVITVSVRIAEDYRVDEHSVVKKTDHQ